MISIMEKLLGLAQGGGSSSVKIESNGIYKGAVKILRNEAIGAARANSPEETHFLKPVQGEDCSQTQKQGGCSKVCQRELEIIVKIRKSTAPRGFDGQFLHTLIV